MTEKIQLENYVKNAAIIKLLNSNFKLRDVESLYSVESLLEVHNLYKKIKENNLKVDNELLQKIIIIEDYLEEYLQKQNKFKERKNIIFSNEDINRKLLNNINTLLKRSEYVSQMEGTFSINEEFNDDNIELYSDDINAVTLITPLQTISRFNDAGGYLGTGDHTNEFQKIQKAVYDEVISNNNTIPDNIVIKYINNCFYRELKYVMIIEVPIPINSTQKKSLEFLNNEIKKFEEKSGEKITISSAIFNDYELIEEMSSPNLDGLLEDLIIDDSYEPKYKDKYLVGVPNNENHFNDSNFKLSEYNNSKSK